MAFFTVNARGVPPLVKLDGARNTHDLARPLLVYSIRIVSNEQLLPQWVLIWKKFARERFIHKYDPRRSLRIVSVQQTSPLQRNPQRPKKARAHFVISSSRSVVRGRRR